MVQVCPIENIPDGGFLRVEVAGKAVALYRDGQEIHAFAATCPHMGGPLEEGSAYKGIVTCPWHGWEFRMATGECLDMPTCVLRTYKTQVREQCLFIDVQP